MNVDAEFRGTDNIWVAPITKDDSTGYTFGTPVNIASTGQISKTTNSSSETHYYSNVGSIVIITNGGDTVTITTPVLDLDKLALLTGQPYDTTTGAVFTGDLKETYFALIYREQLTDDTWRYVVKYKATLSEVPEEVAVTRSDGVNTNGQQLVFSCNKTVYAFAECGHADGMELDERDGKCNFSTFFDTVYTPDTVVQLAKTSATSLSVSPTTATIDIDETATITPTVTPSGTHVSWVSSNPCVASVDGSGVVTGNSEGVAVIIATASPYSASCTVTVDHQD